MAACLSVPPRVVHVATAGDPRSTFSLFVLRAADRDDAVVVLRQQHEGTARSAAARAAQVLRAAEVRHGADLCAQVIDNTTGLPIAWEALA